MLPYGCAFNIRVRVGVTGKRMFMLFQLAHQRFFIALLSMDMLIFASPANQFPCGLVTFGTVCMRSISFVHPAGINQMCIRDSHSTASLRMLEIKR